MITSGTPVRVETDMGTFTGALIGEYGNQPDQDVHIHCSTAPLGYWCLHYWHIRGISAV